MKDKIIIGVTEKIIITGRNKSKEVIARIDTGASKSSVHSSIATELNMGPMIKTKIVRSAHGSKIRPVVKAEVVLAGKSIIGEFSIADRSHMKYKVLIGRDVLKNGFLIDPCKSVIII